MNHYAVLGIVEGASLEDIKKSYKQLSKRYHPNSTSGESSSEKFIIVKKSYDELLKNYKPPKPPPKKEPFNGERYYRVIDPKHDLSTNKYYVSITIPENKLYTDVKIHCMWTNEFIVTLQKGKTLPLTIEIKNTHHVLTMHIIPGI